MSRFSPRRWQYAVKDCYIASGQMDTLFQVHSDNHASRTVSRLQP
jgi:hypothetical protein